MDSASNTVRPNGSASGVGGMEESTANTPAAESAMQLASVNVYEDFEEDYLRCLLSPLVPPSFKYPVSPEIPPSLPLLPPLPKSASSLAPPWLFPFNPSAPSLMPLCCVDLPGVFQSPALPNQTDLQPSIRSLYLALSAHLGSSVPRLHRGPLSLRHHWALTSLQLRLGKTSLCLCHGLTGLQICFIHSLLQPRQAPPSLQLHLSPLAPWLHLGCLSVRLRFGLQDHWCCPVSLALCLCPGFHILRLNLRPSSLWCRWPNLHHGSSLRSTLPWALVLAGLWIIILPLPWLLPPFSIPSS